MLRAKLCVTALFLTAAFAASGSTVAAATPNDEHVQVRVYDSWHHDYHNWDEHRKHKYQHNYWNWRHSHPDHD
jgi:hypothetical protein